MFDKQPLDQQMQQAFNQVKIGDDSSKIASEFLLSLRADPQGIVAAKFIEALKSDSEIIAQVALTALKRIGRNREDVILALSEVILDKNRFTETRYMALEALAALRTPRASEACVEVVHQLVNAKEEMLLYSLGQVLQRYPRSFAAFFNQFQEMGTRIIPFARDKFLNFCESILSKARLDYEQFCREGGIEEGKIDLSDVERLTIQNQKIGSLSIVSDCIVTYDTRYDKFDDPHPRMARAVVISRGEDDFLVVAVWDARTSLSLMNTYERFATFMHKSLLSVGCTSPSSQVELGIYQLVKPFKPVGEFTGVVVSNIESQPEITQWLGDENLDEWAGADSLELRKYLSTTKPLSPQFIQYLNGLIEDEVIAERFAAQNIQSGEAYLDYTSLTSSFSAEVASAWKGEKREQSHRTVFGDSLDSEENREFYARGLPEEIRELLLRYDQIASMYDSELAEPEYKSPLFYDWPYLDEFPQEYLSTESYPYALESHSDLKMVHLLLDPIEYGVIFFVARPNEGEPYIVSNIPHTAFVGSNGFGWGYSGSGPLEFAANILNRFVPPDSDGLEPLEQEQNYWQPRRISFLSGTAHRLGSDFQGSFLQSPKMMGAGYISSQRIQEWVLDKISRISKK